MKQLGKMIVQQNKEFKLKMYFKRSLH